MGRNNTNAVNKEPAARRTEEEAASKVAGKCKHNDKAICLKKDACQFVHNKTVCTSYSKHGECASEVTCMKRHPHGVCHRYKRGVCDRGTECFYRHPEGEECSEQRKRALSSEQVMINSKSQKLDKEEQKKQGDHFLLKKMMDIEKKLERKEDNIPVGWINSGWPATSTHVPAFSPHPVNPLAPSYQAPTPNHVNAYQTPYPPATPSGSQWVPPQQPPLQLMFPFPGAHQYQN